MLALSNESVFRKGIVTLRPLAISRECSCPQTYVRDNHRKIDVLVRTYRVHRPLVGVAYCVPPLYNVDAHRLSTLRDDVLRQQRAGVAHTYIYTSRCSALPFQLANVTWLCMEWVHATRMHSRGQNWQINDCLKRSWDAGYAWTLNKDVDERLVGLDLRTLSDDVDVYTLERMENGTRAMCDKEACLTYEGQRKHVVSTSRVHIANIHYVTKCVDRVVVRCRIRHLQRREAYVHHGPSVRTYSGMPGAVYHPKRLTGRA